jgi:putative ABC transport system permease protein
MKHLLHLAWRSAWNRRLTLGLTLTAITLSVTLLLGVERLRQEAHRGFSLSVSGTDLVAGARTSPVQLMLYSVFRIGEATSNMRWESYQRIAEHPLVAWAVPVSLGDSHRGLPVMGTTNAYFEHFRYGKARKLEFLSGQPFRQTFDVVLGADVAKRLGYQPGERIVLSHGTGESGLAEHGDKPFRVTGILAPTGTPVDRTLHISLEGMTAIHLDWMGGVPMPGFNIPAEHVKKFDLTPKEITAVLIGLKSRAAVFRVQREINENPDEALLAVMPGVALEQLWQVAAVAEKSLFAISALVVVTSLAGLMAVLLASLSATGARPRDILLLVTGESLLVTLIAELAGVLLLLGVSTMMAPVIQARLGITLSASGLALEELYLLAAIAGVGLLAGLLPAWRAYRLSLADGLIPRN